jgi:hypothetical protein
MATSDSNDLAELDRLKAGLHKQLDAKSTLFDPLHAPATPPPPNPEDYALNYSIKTAGVFYILVMIALLGIGIATLLSDKRPSDSFGAWIPLVTVFSFLGGFAIPSVRLLRKRVLALEADVCALRRELRAAHSANQDLLRQNAS